MQIDIQRSAQRGLGKHSWLTSHFSFSFADYYNPKRMGFGKLLVLNDDTIAPNHGFGLHHHDNMEIITIILSGELEHQDSTGAKEVLRKGDIQVMSAGKGIMHSEFNHSQTATLELLQIWVTPHKKDIVPRHARTSLALTTNVFVPVASYDSRNGSLHIEQNALVSLGKFHAGKETEISLAKNHGCYIFVIEGAVDVVETTLKKRDAIGIWDCEDVSLTFLSDSFVLVFDVPL